MPKINLSSIAETLTMVPDDEFTLFTSGGRDFTIRTKERILYLVDKYFYNYDRSKIKLNFYPYREEVFPFWIEYGGKDITAIISDALVKSNHAIPFDGSFVERMYSNYEFAFCNLSEIDGEEE